MSVEHQTEVTSRETNDAIVCATTNNVDDAICGGDASHTEGVSDDASSAASFDRTAAATWFEGLQAAQIPSAMGFADEAFLVQMMEWANQHNSTFSPSSVLEANNMTTASDLESSLSKSGNSCWEIMVSPSSSVVDESAKVNVEADRIEAETESALESSKTEIASTGESGEKPADDIRIQSENTKETKEEGNQDDFRSRPGVPEFLELLGKLKVVLPSALTRANIVDSNNNSPLVTIDPKYIEDGGSNNIMSILDQAAGALFANDDEPFLSNDHPEWQRRHKQTLPLYALLLARMEQAIMDSYHQYNTTAREGNTSTKNNNNNSDNTTLPGTTNIVPSDKIQPLLGKVTADQDLASSLDNNTVEKIVRPFFEACQIPQSQYAEATAQGVPALSLTPLEWLLQGQSSGKSITTLHQIDAVVKESHDRLDQAEASGSSEDDDKEDNTSDVVPELVDPPASPSNVTRKGGKKKRKRLRNKKKHRANNAAAVANKPAAVVSDVPPSPPPIAEVPVPPAATPVTTAPVESATPPPPAAKTTTTSSSTPSSSRSRRKGGSSNAAASRVGKTTVASFLYISDDSDDDSDESSSDESAVPPVVAAPPPLPEVQQQQQQQVQEQQQPPSESDEAWETVEVKSRNNRKKAGGQHRNNNNNRGHMQKPKGSRGGNNNINNNMNNSSSNSNNNNSATRKRNNNAPKKPVTVKPTEEERVPTKEVVTQPTTPRQTGGGNPWGKPVASSSSSSSPSNKETVSTMRDIVVGKQTNKTSARHVVSPVRTQKSDAMIAKQSPSTADQNTAPTFQETVSASSNIAGRKTGQLKAEDDALRSDAGTGDSDDAPQNAMRSTAQRGEKGTPVPTLLSPQNGTSSTSSVASSLEAPHSLHRHHHSSTQPDSNDVGCHLLDVCDRLSSDMGLFMSLRSQALVQRRRERETLLGSLQESVNRLWPGKCNVQLYGSCATQLDLPSSDLDVVVMGLGSEPSPPSTVTRNAHPPYQRMSPNGERIKLLGTELENQPWAVRVNAIPTASVPVVKVLADPTRLGGPRPADWEEGQAPSSPDGEPSSMQHPWRGADVMNGLLSFDITFEGPEHGGIGSTRFSSQTVAEACNELRAVQGTDVKPEDTPLVQVLMVLKELLAQRKLNEPYSGGLGSYAILLLVLAILRERAIIRRDIEQAELFRQAVEARTAPVKQTEAQGGQDNLKSVSSWAAIAKNKSSTDLPSTTEQPKRPASFADAVARASAPDSSNPDSNSVTQPQPTPAEPQSVASTNSEQTSMMPPVMFQQNYNDVIEVLCSGEPTAGKLLMHFLLHYGEYFDAQTTAIDISLKHEREMSGMNPYSPFMARTAAGSIDPITGMLTVHPIVIYDPLEGAENHNVARRCFAWNSIKWIFAQSYSTLSSMVERNTTPPTTPSNSIPATANNTARGTGNTTEAAPENDGVAIDVTDPSSPILRSLLSF